MPPPLAPSRGGAREMTTTRFVAYLSIFGAFFILATVTFLGIEQYYSARRETVRTLESEAYLLADHAGRLFEVADIALRSAANVVHDRSWAELAGSTELHRQLKAIAASLPYVDDIWLNDERGDLRLTSFAFPAPASNASDRDAFKAQREPNDRLHVGERIVGRVTNLPTFLLAKRLENSADKSFRGMVSVTADLQYFNDYWNRVRLPENARIRLFRSGVFDVLAQHPTPPAGQAMAPFNVDRVRTQMAINPVEGLLEAPASEIDEARIVVYRRVAELPVYISVGVPIATVTDLWFSRIRTYVFSAALALAALGALAWLALREARREERDRQRLLAAQRELASANERLEATVAERTAELMETNEEIQRYAYIVSHDLRAPLVNIMGFTSELEAARKEFARELGDNPHFIAFGKELDEATGFIRAATVKMESLIGAILKISRRRPPHLPA